ncbi:MAG: TraR/DksA C4-type zinc finger protein [Candidatus Pacebacteria bacterium]|nr:TraR/DksA C4-type zinc finger protein [Candidatus Paceibacterota bacterium]
MDTQYYKKKLEDELKLLTKELKTVGRINPDNPNDWEATGNPETNQDDDHSDLNDNADDQEEFRERNAILTDLEIRFNNVKNALKKIDEDNYGICKECGEDIEKERLEANPAAETCIKHKK